jgi:hypothetical protein
MDKPEQPENGLLAILQRKELQVGVLTDASKLISDAAQAALRTGKAASVTITVSVKPHLNALNFGVKLKSTIPADAEPLCIFYADIDGKLHRDDPRQKEFNLSVHPGGKDEKSEQPANAAAN